MDDDEEELVWTGGPRAVHRTGYTGVANGVRTKNSVRGEPARSFLGPQYAAIQISHKQKRALADFSRYSLGAKAVRLFRILDSDADGYLSRLEYVAQGEMGALHRTAAKATSPCWTGVPAAHHQVNQCVPAVELKIVRGRGAFATGTSSTSSPSAAARR